MTSSTAHIEKSGRIKAFRTALFFSFLVFFLFPCRASCSGPAGVFVIVSSSIEPYKLARQGLGRILIKTQPDLTITDYNLEVIKPEVLVRELERKRPAVVIVIGTPAHNFAKAHIQDIPTVFCMVLIPGVLNPNMGGVSMDVPAGVKLKRMLKILPNAKRVGVIYSPASAAWYDAIVRASGGLGLTAVGRQITSKEAFPDALNSLYTQIDYFLMIPDSMVYIPQSVQFTLLESLRNKFPVVGLSASYVKAGAFASFDCDYEDLGRQAGEIALRLLAGAAPAGTPTAEPRKTDTYLNIHTAKRLGIELPGAIVKEAAGVFGE